MKEKLLSNFLRISSIPRESGHEDKIADFFVEVAKKNNLFYFKDEYNNVLIKKKGTNNKEPLALQAHLDMVCVKEKNSGHDFNKGIDVIIDGDKITAKETSLGADQGVGLAIMLTMMEDDTLIHPDLEFILTTEEETTFNGAIMFPYEKVSSKRMINLDNSKDNSIVIGSTGDICNEYYYVGNRMTTNMPGYKITLENFPGGNSGESIELSKNNAITTMAELLNKKNILLASIQGGNNENDLASSCEVILNTEEDVNLIFKDVTKNIELVENNTVFNREDTINIINEILDLKGGYLSETASANLGLIETVENRINIKYLLRSMDERELNYISEKTKKLDNKFEIKEIYTDSVWKIEGTSKLLELYRKIYFEQYENYPISEITHSGMEPSTIKKKIENLDVISIGADIENFHTTKEVTYLSSWIKIYSLLLELLKIID